MENEILEHGCRHTLVRGSPMTCQWVSVGDIEPLVGVLLGCTVGWPASLRRKLHAVKDPQSPNMLRATIRAMAEKEVRRLGSFKQWGRLFWMWEKRNPSSCCTGEMCPHAQEKSRFSSCHYCMPVRCCPAHAPSAAGATAPAGTEASTVCWTWQNRGDFHPQHCVSVG